MVILDDLSRVTPNKVSILRCPPTKAEISQVKIEGQNPKELKLIQSETH